MIDYISIIEALSKTKSDKDILVTYTTYIFPASDVLRAILRVKTQQKIIPVDVIGKYGITNREINFIKYIIEKIIKVYGIETAHNFAAQIYEPSLYVTSIPGLQMSDNLNYLATENKLDPVIGRDNEINQLITILNNRRKRNPVLIGDAGVGKTAIVEGLAQRINNKQVPINMMSSVIFSIGVSQFVEAENGLHLFNAVLQYFEEFKNAILFIDEFHQLGDAKRRSGISLLDVLKPVLARGSISLIAATTEEEYRKIEKDKAMARRMQPIYVREPKIDETKVILEKMYSVYSNYHNVSMSDNSIDMIVRASVNVSGYNPDKSISILDSVMSFGKIKGHGIYYELSDDEVASFIETRYKVKKSFLISKDVDTAIADRISKELPIYSDIAYKLASNITKVHSLTKNNNAVASVIAILVKKNSNRIATALAKILDPEEKFIMIDGSEFSSEISITRILGAPPAYVGYDSSTLFSSISHRPMPIIISNFNKMHNKCKDVIFKAIRDGYIETYSGDRIVLRNVDFIIVYETLTADNWFASKNANIDGTLKTITDIILEARYLSDKDYSVICAKHNKDIESIRNYINDSYTPDEIDKILEKKAGDIIYIK